MRTARTLTCLMALLGAALATAALFTFSSLRPSQAQAAVPGAEQYIVVDLMKFGTSLLFEQELNRLGADGWKVRAGAMGAVILAK